MRQAERGTGGPGVAWLGLRLEARCGGTRIRGCELHGPRGGVGWDRELKWRLEMHMYVYTCVYTYKCMCTCI